MNRIAVLIPCLNEGPTVGTVVSAFREELSEADIYVFDNGSTDDTCARALEAGAVLCSVSDTGKGNVVRAMFASIDADVYVVCDGDGTYDTGKASEMIKLITDGSADMVTARRVPKNRTCVRSRCHSIGTRLISAYSRILYGIPASDILSGFRAFSRKFAKSFPASSDGFEIEAEMTVFAHRENFPTAEVSVQYSDRAGTPSKLRALRDGWRIIKFLTAGRNAKTMAEQV